MCTDRNITAKGATSAKPCISIVMKGLCQALNSAKVFISEDGFRQRVKHFPVKFGIPQWFLAPDSLYEYIPSAKKEQKEQAKQHKCFQVYRSVFSSKTLKILDQGKQNRYQH